MGRQFLVGGTDPRQRIVLAECLVGHFLHRRQRLSGAVARSRAAEQLGRREHVEARIGRRPENALNRDQRRQRHQIATGGTHEDLAEILRLATEVRFRLQGHLPGASVEREVVDVVAAESRLHRGKHIVDRYPDRTRLGTVEIDVVLRHVRVEGTVHPRQFRTFGCSRHELLHDLPHLLSRAAATVLDIGLEAASSTHAGDRRRVEGHHYTILIRRPHAHEGVGQVARIQFRRSPFLPVLQRHEGHTGVADGAVGQDVQTGEGQHVLHGRVLHQLLGDVAGQLRGAGDRSRRRQVVGVDHIALVLIRHQGARHPAEQHDHQADHAGKQDQTQRRPLEEELHASAITGRGLVEHAVEPAERRRRFLVPGLENQRAECRGKRQCDDAGNHHGYRDGDRELLVHLSGKTAEEANRNEHRTEHQYDGDDRPGHLFHRLDRRFTGSELLRAHHTLDVLQHHDGIVHHDTNGQHQAEQGQQVDGEAQRIHPGEGADQRNRNRQDRDQRGADVLQEQEDHQHHQDQRLDEGVDHLLDGHLHEHRGVVGDLVGHAGGEFLRQPCHGVAHRLGGIQRVGAGLQIDTERGVLLAVQCGDHRVVLGTQFHSCHILQQQAGASGIAAQDDALEFLWIAEASLGGHRISEVLRLVQRLLTETAGGELRVLLTDRVHHIGRRQVVLRQLVRTQPDTHGVVLGAELADVTYARKPLQFVDDVHQRVVADEDRVARAVRRIHRHDLEDVGGFLLHLHALPAHFLRQLGQRGLDLVVDVDGGLVGIGAHLEVHRQAHGAAGVGVGQLVDHALDAVDLLLQRRCHGLGDHLRAGAWVHGGHGHLRRKDFRVLRDRQGTQRSQPAEQDDDGNHHGEYGAVDEEARNHDKRSLIRDWSRRLVHRPGLASRRFSPAGRGGPSASHRRLPGRRHRHRNR
ncbi:hypothetical protein D3C76_557850 [compost metagenome]